MEKVLLSLMLCAHAADLVATDHHPAIDRLTIQPLSYCLQKEAYKSNPANFDLVCAQLTNPEFFNISADRTNNMPAIERTINGAYSRSLPLFCSGIVFGFFALHTMSDLLCVVESRDASTGQTVNLDTLAWLTTTAGLAAASLGKGIWYVVTADKIRKNIMNYQRALEEERLP